MSGEDQGGSTKEEERYLLEVDMRIYMRVHIESIYERGINKWGHM